MPDKGLGFMKMVDVNQKKGEYFIKAKIQETLNNYYSFK